MLKKQIHLFLGIVVLTILTTSINAQLSGNILVGSGQTYTSLTANTAAGFFRAVNTSGLSGNVTVYITSDITEPGDVALNQWSVGSGFTITIRPNSAGLYSLSSATSGNAISFNGADNVVIDGRYNGSGRYLRFSTSNTGASTFRFVNDATGNTLTYCIIEGTSSSATDGVIEFSTTTGTNGNDNNTISNCLIRDYTTTPMVMIYSSGSTTTSATYNSNITISNNEIYNFYRNGQVCSGVKLENGSTDWTISGNSFYQTSTRTATSSTTYIVVYVNTSNANNVTVSGNYLGGGAANCGGSAWTLNGAVTNTMHLIRFAAAGTSTASNIDGNYIQNISFTSQPSTGSVVYFAGIIVENGTVNVGSTTGNVIGNTTSNGNISITYNGSSNNLISRGIDYRRTGSVNNNTIGSITTAGSNTSLVRFEAIFISGAPGTTINVNNNTIGSSTQTNSIYASNSSQYIELAGVYSNISSGSLSISGNTIGNMTNLSTNSAAYLRGIIQTGNNIPVTVTNNTLLELLCSGSSTSRAPTQLPVIGIVTNSSSTSQTVTGNTIYGIRANGNAGTHVSAFGHSNSSSGGTFARNKIYDVTNSSTTGSPKLWAVNAYWGSWNYYNNQVSVTNGEASDYVQNNPPVLNTTPISERYKSESKNFQEGQLQDFSVSNVAVIKDEYETDASTNEVEVKGLHDEAEFACTYYYNTIYVGGTAATGASNSWAYDRPLSSWPTPVTMRNNIFFNARTGGTGKHYAFGNEIGATNWTSASSNYNVFISANSSTVAVWSTTDQTIDQWRTTSGGDKHTWSTTTSSISASSLFTSISTGNLNINTGNSVAWIVSGKGIAVSGQSTDYEGNTRPTTVSGGVTDIGADEFTATPPGNPTATQDVTPGSGVTSNYTLWGRTIVTINWGTGGSSYPSNMTINYYSGVDPLNVVSGNYSKSYWSINPVGTLTGATYDVTINFGDNETYTITSPSVNTRVSNYLTSFWFVYLVSGTAPMQTELNYTNTWAKTRGLNTFTDFALTDESSPMPVELCSFNANIVNRNVTLNWSTCSELNNMGFEIERRQFNKQTGEYYPWIRHAFVEGKGTTNQAQYYSFTDYKLNTGRYQYRLKQVDFNGNYEYHNLSQNSDIMIGSPMNADLFQNYPNPSNPVSKVDYQIPFNANVSLKVYDLTGKEVATLADGQMESGFYTAEFNGSNLASGVYFYRLIAQSNDGTSFTKTMKLILVK